MNLISAKRQLENILNQKQDKLKSYPALLGDGQGNVAVATRPGYVYVRIGNENTIGQAYNQRVAEREDLPVMVGYDPVEPSLFQVLSTRQSAYVSAGYTLIPDVVSHHVTHEWPNINDADSDGSDVVYIRWRQVQELRVYIDSGFTVGVARSPVYRDGVGWVWIAEQTIDLSGYQPGGFNSAKYMLIYLDENGILTEREGAVVAMATIDISDCPEPLPGEFPLAAVLLYSGQTGLSDDRDEQNIIDLRWPQTYQAKESDEIPLSSLADYTQGYVIRGGAADWEAHSAEAAGFILVGDGADVSSQAFDWDVLAAGAGADMVHNHSSDVEGGEIPLASLGSYAQGALIYGGGADWAALAHPGAANRVLVSTAAEVGWSAQAVTFPAAGTVPVGSGANKRVAYWTAANTLAGDAGMTYDAVTDSLEIAGDITVIGGAAHVGFDDSEQGFLYLYGPLGGLGGGTIHLYLSGAYDGVFDYWALDTYEDDLRVFRNDTVVANRFTAEGQLWLPTTGAAGGLLVGGDCQWYRGAANQWYTPDGVDIAGHVALGSVASIDSTIVSYISEDVTALAGNYFGERVTMTFSPTANFATTVFGMFFQVELETAWARTAGGFYGIRGVVTVANGIAATNLNLVGSQFFVDVQDAAAVVGEGVQVYTPFVDTGTCASGYGIRILQGTVGAGSVTTLYGLYIAALTAGGTDYAIYSAGGQSYHAGNVGIGMTPTANGVLCLGLPTQNLEIIDSGTVGATEQAWIEVENAGVQGFIRVFNTK